MSDPSNAIPRSLAKQDDQGTFAGNDLTETLVLLMQHIAAALWEGQHISESAGGFSGLW